jgi:hypothetical protein
MKRIINATSISLFLLLATTCSLIYITNHFILTVNFYAKSGDFVSAFPGQELEVYQTLQKWIYLSSVLYLLIKLCSITLILYTALFLSGYELSFEKLFRVTVFCEYIFMLPAVIKIIGFRNAYPEGNLMDWHKYFVLSSLSLFPAAPADWYYTLQTFNVFEIVYWFLLAFGISRAAQLTFDHSLRIVVSSYLPALIVWVALITFCSLVMFPVTA